MTCGDNIQSVHKMHYLEDSQDIVVAYCERCKYRAYIRKCAGRTDPRYSKIFRRDTLQPGTNLHAREYPHTMNVLS